MFTEYINRILESERDFGSNRQEEVTTPDVIEKSSIIDKTIPEKYKKDIEALRDMYIFRSIPVHFPVAYKA